jgi:hypothetical protein
VVSEADPHGRLSKFSKPIKQVPGIEICNCFWGVERDQRVKLITSSPSGSRLSRHCGDPQLVTIL